MEREARSLAEVLQQFLQEQGLQEVLYMARLPKVWAEVVGTPAARSSTIRSFANGELVVEVAVPAWRMELHMRAEELRRRLNERLGRELVRRLVIR
ncbi:MAG: DUF721 domain-containing protein [Candidatus Kapabacteria bacterium]|nr:DUF721 domain-containing protein [Candidatus Kapabacteria bacterium]MDW8011628.1 DUF721 domain-containing protein [Bacteroidota bacterium]